MNLTERLRTNWIFLCNGFKEPPPCVVLYNNRWYGLCCIENDLKLCRKCNYKDYKESDIGGCTSRRQVERGDIVPGERLEGKL